MLVGWRGEEDVFFWRRAAYASIAVTLLSSVGCVHENVLALAPGSRGDSLVFVLRSAHVGADPNLVFGLSVIRCADDVPMWTISADGSRTMPDSLLYGQVIPGFPVRAGPFPLAPDCYRAIASGAAPLRFDVGVTGDIKTEP
jgi:hypothetical protein